MNLQIIEHQKQRVLLTQQLAEVMELITNQFHITSITTKRDTKKGNTISYCKAMI